MSRFSTNIIFNIRDIQFEWDTWECIRKIFGVVINRWTTKKKATTTSKSWWAVLITLKCFHNLFRFSMKKNVLYGPHTFYIYWHILNVLKSCLYIKVCLQLLMLQWSYFCCGIFSSFYVLQWNPSILMLHGRKTDVESHSLSLTYLNRKISEMSSHVFCTFSQVSEAFMYLLM